jgi:hypothetical protein
MARYQLTKAIYSDAQGVGRVRAGRWIADSAASAQPGDVVWPGVTAAQLPAGVTTAINGVATGVDSVDG